MEYSGFCISTELITYKPEGNQIHIILYFLVLEFLCVYFRFLSHRCLQLNLLLHISSLTEVIGCVVRFAGFVF